MDDPEEFRRALERKVRAESSHGWDRARKQWGKPLGERVDSGRAIAGLVVSSRETTGKRQVVHFHPSVEDMSMFREGDLLRLSRNDPDGPDFIDAMFLGLTEKGLSIAIPKQAVVQPETGWTLDESMFDLKDLYLKALDELAATLHGREVVMPTLLGGVGEDLDFDAHEGFSGETRCSPAWRGTWASTPFSTPPIGSTSRSPAGHRRISIMEGWLPRRRMPAIGSG